MKVHPSGLTESEVQDEADRLAPIIAAYSFHPADVLRPGLVRLLRRGGSPAIDLPPVPREAARLSQAALGAAGIG